MQGEDERSIGELLAELLQETAELMRRELRLTEAEMTQKAYRAAKNAGFIVAAVGRWPMQACQRLWLG
jgi:hypothetical protein